MRDDRTFNPNPITLTGTYVRLEPLALTHAADLFAASSDPNIWQFMPIGPPKDVCEVKAFIETAITDAKDGKSIPFATVDQKTNRAIGSTRYLDIRHRDRALEIGWTWISTAYQRTAVNTECKLLLLTHAFETLGAVRVQLKTDLRNLRSQKAIERLGAVREGVLRKQLTLWNGYVRDSVFYSIIDSEWPTVKERLTAALQR